MIRRLFLMVITAGQFLVAVAVISLAVAIVIVSCSGPARGRGF